MHEEQICLQACEGVSSGGTRGKQGQCCWKLNRKSVTTSWRDCSRQQSLQSNPIMRVKRSNDIHPSHWSSIALLTSPTVAETHRERHKHTDKHWTWKQSLHLTATHHQGSSRATSAAMRLTATRGRFCKLPQQQLNGQREGERKTSKTKQIDAKWLFGLLC